MDECCAACCPSPDYPVFRPSPKALRWRLGLQYTIYGELVHVIARCILWGMSYGMFQLINVWIDYMAFATMHFCQCMIVGISGAMDLMMLLMYRDKPHMLREINESTFNEVMYWYCVAFSCIKIIISIGAYSSWKAEFKQQHGHSSICPGPQMRGRGGYGGGPRRSLFDQDDEAGNSSGGYGQSQQSNFRAFQGQGVNAFGSSQQPQNQYQQQQQFQQQQFQQQQFQQHQQPYGGYQQQNQQVYGQPQQSYQQQQPMAPPQYGQPVMQDPNTQFQQPIQDAQPLQQTGPQNATHNSYWRNRGAQQK